MSSQLTRLVKLTLRPAEVDEFIADFEQLEPRIKAVAGCLDVVLLQDSAYPNIVFTLSTWVDEEALNTYRKSDFFNTTWTRTKQRFAAPPQAWSMLKPNLNP